MSKFWRIAFAWLLVLALPMQGFAAQTLLLCGPAHQTSADAHHHAMHEHGDAAMAHDHGSHHASDPDGGPVEALDAAPAAGTDPAPAGKAGHAGKCSVCSSCCHAAAITTGFVAPVVVSPDLPEVAPVLIAEERVIVGGLERPPRHSRT